MEEGREGVEPLNERVITTCARATRGGGRDTWQTEALLLLSAPRSSSVLAAAMPPARMHPCYTEGEGGLKE